MAALFPSDMSDTTVMRIGCTGGFYATRPAERGTDFDPSVADAVRVGELLDRAYAA